MPCTSAICAAQGVRPLPMAQTGSYAMTVLAALAVSGSEARSCAAMTSRVCAPSRSASVSPRQMMAIRPAVWAARAFCATSALVSP